MQTLLAFTRANPILVIALLLVLRAPGLWLWLGRLLNHFEGKS